MDFETKTQQIQSSEPVKNRLNDIDILSPDFEIFKLGDNNKYPLKEYRIYPPKIKQLKIIQRLINKSNELAKFLDASTDAVKYSDMLDSLMGVIGEFIGEPDLEYLENTIGNSNIAELNQIIIRVSSIGFGGDSKKKGNTRIME